MIPSMIVQQIVVHRRSWQTVKDRPDRRRVRHFARITFVGGIEIRSVRLSVKTANQLLAAGAELDDDDSSDVA